MKIESILFGLCLSTFSTVNFVNSQQECIDDPDYRINGQPKKDCKWVGELDRRAEQCKKKDSQINCPLTCGLCCKDNLWKSCKNKKGKDCKDASISILCPKTCKVCCFDDPKYEFKRKGADESMKKCAWIKGKKKKKQNCKGATKKKCGAACGKNTCFRPHPGGGGDPPTKSPTTTVDDRELTFPPIIDNVVNGVLNMDLSHRYADFSSEVFSMTNARLLNGSIPGPTIKVNAGDTLRILYENEMEDQGLPMRELNTFRHMDRTNLHFHGGHVSGELPSDDVRMSISPGSSYQYETTFPSSHMPGTHWVHPHVHGSAALHVSNGAALALIVKDPPNYLPPVIEEAEDILMLIQEFDLSRTKGIVDQMGDKKFGYRRGTGPVFNPNAMMVNGQYMPLVKVRPNAWMRWRVIYAGHNSRPLEVKIDSETCEIVLLAKDGIYIQDFPRPITVAPIPTGGRADLMVRCSKKGTYTMSTFGGETLTVQVSGPTVSSVSLPTWTPTYPPYLDNLLNNKPTPDCTCDTRFDTCTSVQPGDPFLGCINDLPFSEKMSIHSIELGKVVDRRTNASTHSYHQHVYPFQFVRYSQENQSGIAQVVQDYFRVGDWHDVIQMEGLEGNVELRFHPREHLGLLMLHCHRLTHEDRGMMSWEYVYDSGDGVCHCDLRLDA